MEPLHDWAPLSETLDWRLGKLAYQARGVLTFTSNEVPNIAHQGGLVPYRAAEVLLASCQAAHDAGTLEDQIVILEPGMGMGLFARQVLDRFQARCQQRGVDWYDRLLWYATDAAPTVIRDVQKANIFAPHARHVVLGQADAAAPTRLTRIDTQRPVDLTGRVRAIFHSYVFCMLPMNLYRVDGPQIDVTIARTVVSQPEHLQRYTHRSIEQLRQIVASEDVDAALELVPLYPLLDLELGRAPLSAASPSRARVQQIARWIQDDQGTDGPTWVLDSHGAWTSLQASMGALRDDGFVLFRDYGPKTAADADQQQLYQHYGATIAVQINHYALQKLAAAEGIQMTAPPNEGDRLLKTRLVSRAEIPQVRAAFQDAYDLADVEALQARIDFAREAPRAQIVSAYQAALAMEPGNWSLLTEAADAIYRRLQDPAQAYELVRRSLAINPCYQAVAWDLLGEMFLDAGEMDQSQKAFERARQINPEHARVHAGLARLHHTRGEIEAAVKSAAEAVAWAEVDGLDAEIDVLNLFIQELTQRRQLSRTLRGNRAAGGWHKRFSL
ncbi:MAG: tetratricopeptide repeat protein [Myxococcota bacterium]